MVELEYVGNAVDGFMVHISGRAPRFIDPHAFLNTFGTEKFEEHVLGDVDVSSVKETKVVCVPSRFPNFSVTWSRDGDDLDGNSGLVHYEGRPFTKVSAPAGGYEIARQKVKE